VSKWLAEIQDKGYDKLMAPEALKGDTFLPENLI